MTNSPDILAAVLPIAEAFEAFGIAYYIGGSVASSVQGIARSTIDVDLVADLLPAQVQPLVERLLDEYYIDAGMLHEAIRERASFNLIHLATMIKVDVFILKARPFDREMAARIEQKPLEDEPGARSFPVASPENVILNKLEWYRQGNEISERQWLDIQGVLKVQAGNLALPYLRTWAAQLGLEDLLDRALRDAGVIE